MISLLKAKMSLKWTKFLPLQGLWILLFPLPWIFFYFIAPLKDSFLSLGCNPKAALFLVVFFPIQVYEATFPFGVVSISYLIHITITILYHYMTLISLTCQIAPSGKDHTFVFHYVSNQAVTTEALDAKDDGLLTLLVCFRTYLTVISDFFSPCT